MAMLNYQRVTTDEVESVPLLYTSPPPSGAGNHPSQLDLFNVALAGTVIIFIIA